LTKLGVSKRTEVAAAMQAAAISAPWPMR
jgi:hypothetical protein